MQEINGHDRFVLRQRFRLVINQYEFSIPTPDGEDGKPVCFVEQKRFKFKEGHPLLHRRLPRARS